MNPWWSFNGLKNRLGRFKFLIFLTLLLSGVAFAGYKIGAVIDVWQSERLQGQEFRLSNLYQELDQKIRQINYLTVELEVEKKANAQMQQELLQIRQESFELRRELNFYQKVLAPELVANGISVEQFQVEPTNMENRYRFRFALVQTDSQKRNAKGYIRIKLLGTQQESTQSYDLAELAGLSKGDLKFSFHYFQYFEGEVVLPEGMLPESLEVKVVLPKTKWQKYKSFTQVLQWPKIEIERE